MKNLKTYIRGWKKQLRTVLSSKRLVVLVSVASLIGTLLFVNILKTKSYDNKLDEQVDLLYLSEIQNKKAVSVTTAIAEIPIEFLYPGTKVDVVNKNGADIDLIVSSVYILGITILEQEMQARIVLAVDDTESQALLKKREGFLSFIVHGKEDAKNKKHIEIIEL